MLKSLCHGGDGDEVGDVPEIARSSASTGRRLVGTLEGKNPRSSKSPPIQASRVRVVRLSRERSSRRLKASQYLRASEKLLCISSRRRLLRRVYIQ